MKNEDIEIGMKVIPHSKSIVGPLSSSATWKEAIKRNQQYLIVQRHNDDYDCWILNDSDSASGDYFKASDFEPYEELKIGDYVCLIDNLKSDGTRYGNCVFHEAMRFTGYKKVVSRRNDYTQFKLKGKEYWDYTPAMVIKKREEMKKKIEVTIEQARKLKDMPEWKEVIEASFTKEELDERCLTWKQIRNKHNLCSTLGLLIDDISRDMYMKIRFRLIWTLIAEEYNQGWIPDWDDNNQPKYCISKTGSDIPKWNCRYVDNNGEVFFKSLELIMEAYKNNREIVEGMLK